MASLTNMLHPKRGCPEHGQAMNRVFGSRIYNTINGTFQSNYYPRLQRDLDLLGGATVFRETERLIKAALSQDLNHLTKKCDPLVADIHQRVNIRTEHPFAMNPEITHLDTVLKGCNAMHCVVLSQKVGLKIDCLDRIMDMGGYELDQNTGIDYFAKGSAFEIIDEFIGGLTPLGMSSILDHINKIPRQEAELTKYLKKSWIEGDVRQMWGGGTGTKRSLGTSYALLLAASNIDYHPIKGSSHIESFMDIAVRNLQSTMTENSYPMEKYLDVFWIDLEVLGIKNLLVENNANIEFPPNLFPIKCSEKQMSALLALKSLFKFYSDLPIFLLMHLAKKTVDDSFPQKDWIHFSAQIQEMSQERIERIQARPNYSYNVQKHKEVNASGKQVVPAPQACTEASTDAGTKPKESKTQKRNRKAKEKLERREKVDQQDTKGENVNDPQADNTANDEYFLDPKIVEELKQYVLDEEEIDRKERKGK